MHILVDVAAERLRAELIELLERAGHTRDRRAAPARAPVRRDLFLMPPEDPALGLDVTDPI